MLKKDIFFFTLGPIAASLLSAITIPILAWNFSVADMGRLSFLQMLISFSVLFFSFGLDEAYLREFHEVRHKSRLLRTVVLPGFLAVMAISALICAVGLAVFSSLLFEFEDSSLGLVAVCGVITAFSLRFLTLILRIKEESIKYALVGLVPKFFQILFVIFCVYILEKISLTILLLSYVLPNIFALLCAIFLTKRDLTEALKARIQFPELKRYMAYGAPLVFAGFGSWALISLDKLFLRGMSSIDELGIYSVAASVAALVGVLTGIVNTILAPIIYKMSVDGEYTKINQMILNERILASTLFIFIIGGLTNWIVPMLFPPAYQNIDSFILCCVASPLLYTLSEVSSIGINLARKTSLVFLAVLCALVANSVGNYYLVPSLGASGAAIATAVGFYCYFLVKVLSANHVMAKVPIVKLLGFPLICILLMISEAYFNFDRSFIFRLLWALMGLVVAISFKTSLIEFKQLFSNYLRDRLAARG